VTATLRASSFDNIVDDADVTEPFARRNKKAARCLVQTATPARASNGAHFSRTRSSATMRGVVHGQQCYSRVIFGLFRRRNKAAALHTTATI